MSTLTLKQFVESTASPLTWDDLFDWPPDVFAITSAVLKRTGIYRHVICPPEREEWPPTRTRTPRKRGKKRTWAEAAAFQATRWLSRRPRQALPPLVAHWKSTIEGRWTEVTMEALTDVPDEQAGTLWPLCEALLGLHCIADRTCLGFGTPMSPTMNGVRQFLADHLLSVHGSLSRLPKSRGIVLPKMRTPQTGLTLRALSLFASWHETEVAVEWRSLPLINPDENTLNVLIVPWPEEVKPIDFKSCLHPRGNRAAGRYRYFEYAPAGTGCPIQEVIDAIRSTSPLATRVHMLVFPELALSFDELTTLKSTLVDELDLDQVPRAIVSGVRDWPDPRTQQLQPCNQVVLSLFFAGRWYDIRQGKHHRWKLDPRQVAQYNVGGVLASHKGWWEQLSIGRRSLSIFAPTGWLAVSPLICEDLAQLEPVAEVIRGVGPTLLIALLLDGPQLAHRWSARYASVLADDPGSSVLTVTALGMSQRSIPRNVAEGDVGDRTIASWRDNVNGFRPIAIGKDDRAVLLTLTAEWTEEFTADGRSDQGAAARFLLTGVHSIHVERTESMAVPEAAGNGRTVQRLVRRMKRHPAHLERASARDTLELTTFSQAVDNTLDGTLEDVCAVCEIARLFDARSIIDRLMTNGAAPHAPAVEERPAAKDDYADGLYYYQRLFTELLTKHPRAVEYARWRGVINLVERELQGLRSAEDGANAAGQDDDDLLRQRTEVAVLTTLVWAVHNRLETRRFDGTISASGAALLQRTQRLLDAV